MDAAAAPPPQNAPAAPEDGALEQRFQAMRSKFRELMTSRLQRKVEEFDQPIYLFGVAPSDLCLRLCAGWLAKTLTNQILEQVRSDAIPADAVRGVVDDWPFTRADLEYFESHRAAGTRASASERESLKTELESVTRDLIDAHNAVKDLTRDKAELEARLSAADERHVAVMKALEDRLATARENCADPDAYLRTFTRKSAKAAMLIDLHPDRAPAGVASGEGIVRNAIFAARGAAGNNAAPASSE